MPNPKSGKWRVVGSLVVLGGFGVEIPIRTRTENNNDEHWRVRQKRAKMQRETVRQWLLVLQRLPGNCCYIPLPVTVTLIRVAPRQLDHIDNLSSSLKHIRDSVADFYEVNDRTPLITWVYDQQRGRPHYYAVRLILEPRREG